MTFSNPEYKEKTEKYREQQMLNPDVEKKIIDKIQKGEKYADLVFCPNKKCGCSLSIEEIGDFIKLKCNMCGWERMLIQTKSFL